MVEAKVSHSEAEVRALCLGPALGRIMPGWATCERSYWRGEYVVIWYIRYRIERWRLKSIWHTLGRSKEDRGAIAIKGRDGDEAGVPKW
jgi:hypothetical protein